ncbi:MAG: bifunctional phosphopantothenoylcysteine decarboxylase/phosphopantothenate--cysteine ligase CoaBC [Chromatiales bacterium]|nr:bifunctional phosphopantothenoylcysteine decarboxylase/phosphopantothenate--cysteine ligase CoaBC [Chromatiales bacterium]
MTALRDKRILLGVSGGIAAYKSPDLVRRLRERGAEVRVVMTESAARLVSPTVFQAVSGQPVRCGLWDDQAEAAMGHIELARWADIVLVAPATANLMAELAAGSAGSLLTTLCLVSRAPLWLAPAMNQAMWTHPATWANRELLATRGVRFIGPESGGQACGDEGPGRMSEPPAIVHRLAMDSLPPAERVLEGLSVLVTAGPTREPIDPVRFVSNRSSGKMGFAVARAAAEAGARVTLVAGPVSIPSPEGIERVDVETAAQMYEQTMARISGADIYIGAAAISDYRPETIAAQKIKKRADTLALQMVRSPDLLASMAALPSRPFTVGFAAETERLEEHATAKLRGKQLDMIIANLVGARLGFDTDDNSAVVLWEDGREDLARSSKAELAHRIVSVVARRFRARAQSPVTPVGRSQVS